MTSLNFIHLWQKWTLSALTSWCFEQKSEPSRSPWNLSWILPLSLLPSDPPTAPRVLSLKPRYNQVTFPPKLFITPHFYTMILALALGPFPTRPLPSSPFSPTHHSPNKLDYLLFWEGLLFFEDSPPLHMLFILPGMSFSPLNSCQTSSKSSSVTIFSWSSLYRPLLPLPVSQ